MIKIPPATEHQIQTAIMNYLQAKGWMVLRLNSGAMRQTDARGKQYLIRLLPAGTPDILAFKPLKVEDETIRNIALLVFIEVKRPKAKPTFLQIQMMKQLEKYGARCFVASSIEDLQEAGL